MPSAKPTVVAGDKMGSFSCYPDGAFRLQDMRNSTILSNTSSSETASYHHGDLRAALIAAGLRALKYGAAQDISLRGLARDVGVSEAAPSRHFAGKMDLLASIAASGFDDLSDLRRRALVECSDSLTQAYAMMSIYVRFAEANKGLFQLMIGPRILRKADHPELARAINVSFELFASAVRDYARQQGWKKKDMNLVTHAAWSVEHGLATLIIADRVNSDDRRIDIEAMIHFSMALLLAGIAAGPNAWASVDAALSRWVKNAGK